MAVQWLGSPVKVYPSAAAPLTIVPSASIWANGAWTQLIASTPVPWVICGFVIKPIGPTSSGLSREFEFDLGVGAPGSEVVITTIHGYDNATAGTYVAGEYGRCPFSIPIDAAPTGSRLSFRVRQSVTTVRNYEAALYYVEKPFLGTMQTTTKPQKCLPSAAGLVSLTAGGSAWANGSYAQLAASLTADVVISAFAIGVVSGGPVAGEHTEVDIAIGGAGVEVVQFTLRFLHASNLGGPFYQPLALPVDLFPTGQRLSARMRNATASIVKPFGVHYYEKPI